MTELHHGSHVECADQRQCITRPVTVSLASPARFIAYCRRNIASAFAMLAIALHCIGLHWRALRHGAKMLASSLHCLARPCVLMCTVTTLTRCHAPPADMILTCSPCVLMTLKYCPAFSSTARPSPPGTVISSLMGARFCGIAMSLVGADTAAALAALESAAAV